MERLREYMAERGLTQAAFAEMFKVSQPTVSDWLKGRYKPTTDTLIKISDKTGLSLDELLKPRLKRKRPS